MRNQKFTTVFLPTLCIAGVLVTSGCDSDVRTARKSPTGNGVLAPVVPLNDTGVTYYLTHQVLPVAPAPSTKANVFFDHNNKPANAPNGQDADFGLSTIGDSGFRFKKLKGQGRQEVPAPDPNPDNKAAFDCVEDGITHLTWENKVRNPASIHNASNMYTWFNSDENSNGGNAGSNNPGQCANISGNTENFIKQVNQEKLCGYSDWRLPMVEELRSLIDYSKETPNMVDLEYFPYVTMIHHRWSAETYIQDSSKAWGFHMHEGVVQEHPKNCELTGGVQNYFNGILLVRNNPRDPNQ